MIDRLRATRWTPPDYWKTDHFNGLVMVIRNYHCLNSASRVLISTCSGPLVQTGEHKQFSLFDLDLWPTTLTYSQSQGRPSCQKSHSKVKRFKQESAHRQTDKHTDTTKRIIAPATRSIANSKPNTDHINIRPSAVSLLLHHTSSYVKVFFT